MGEGCGWGTLNPYPLIEASPLFTMNRPHGD